MRNKEVMPEPWGGHLPHPGTLDCPVASPLVTRRVATAWSGTAGTEHHANYPGHERGAAFCSLTDEPRVRWSGIGTEKRYRQGSELFCEGQRADNLFILHSGHVKLYVTSQEGKRAIVRIAEAGEALGLSAVLTNTEYEVSAEALEWCQVTVIRTRAFVDFLEKSPEAAREATRCILRDYQALLNEICRLTLPTRIAGRVANLLLDWRNRLSRPGWPSSRFIMVLTREEIAAMTGTSRETVSRILHQFQRDKIIRMKGPLLTILKPEVLEQLKE